MATRGRLAEQSLALRADAMAMSASSSALGSALTAQSAKTNGAGPCPGNPARPSENSSMAARCLGASPTVIRPASIMRRVGLAHRPPWRPRRPGAPSCRRNTVAWRRAAWPSPASSSRARCAAPRRKLAAGYRCADRGLRCRRARSRPRRGRSDCLGGAEHDRLRDSLALEPRSRGNHARVFAFRKNDFAIAPPCDIKKCSSKSIHSHRVRTDETDRKRA